MAPTLPGKSKAELQIECCLQKDIAAALLDFLNGTDVTFSRFKSVWRTSKLGLIPSAAAKERVDPTVYIQIVFCVILSLLDRPVAPTGGSQEHRLQLLGCNNDRLCLWNISVLYCLYAMYHTQERTNMTSFRQMMQPINIGPGTALVLMKTAEQCVAMQEYGLSALEMYKSLWRDGAFRCCAYNGPSSVFYSLRAAGSGGSLLSQSAVTVAAVSGAVAVAVAGGSTTSSSSSAAEVNQANPTTALHNIRQHYNVPSAVATAPPAASQVAVPTNIDADHIFAPCAPVPVTVAASINNTEAEHVTESSGRAPKLPEMLAHSIPARRQMRADIEQHRKDLAQAAVDKKKEKLKKKWLKRVEVAVSVSDEAAAPSRSSRRSKAHDSDAVNIPSSELRPSTRAASSETSATSPVTTTRQRLATKRKYVLQSELPVDASSRIQSAAKLSLDVAFPMRAPAPRLEPSGRRSRSSADRDSANKDELPAWAKATSSRRSAAKTAMDADGADGSDDEGAGLIGSFEEFVGLRASPKSNVPPVSVRVTRNSRSVSVPSATASTVGTTTIPASGADGTSAARRKTATQSNSVPKVTWAPRLDAETGDIMEILNRLETESAAVLEGGVATRTRRAANAAGDTVEAEAEPASKRARKSGSMTTGASAETTTSSSAITSAASSRNRTTTPNQAANHTKAAKPAKKAVAKSGKTVHQRERRIVRRGKPWSGHVGRGCVSDDSADEAPAPAVPGPGPTDSADRSEIMDMLQRLEQESQQILQGNSSSSTAATASRQAGRTKTTDGAGNRIVGNKRTRTASESSPGPSKHTKAQKQSRASTTSHASRSSTSRSRAIASPEADSAGPRCKPSSPARAHAPPVTADISPLPVRALSRRASLAARAISLPPGVVAPVAEVPAVEAEASSAAGSEDIMSLLGWLEHESNEVLQLQGGSSNKE